MPIGNPVEFFLLNTVGVPRTCIHKPILAKFRFNLALKVGEDTELWVRIASEYPIFYNPEYTQAFVAHDFRTVNRKNISAYKENLNNKIKLLKSVKISNEVKKQILHNAYFSLAKSYYENKLFINMCFMLFTTFLYQPRKQWKEKVCMLIGK